MSVLLLCSEFKLQNMFHFSKKEFSRADEHMATTLASFVTLRTTVLVSEQVMTH